MLEAITSKTMEAVSRALLVGFARFISGASVRYITCQPDTNQRIYFANHTSHLDALVIWSLLPPDVRMLTRPVAARDYWERGRLKPYLAKHVFDAMLIYRQNIQVHQSPVDLMRREIGERY